MFETDNKAEQQKLSELIQQNSMIFEDMEKKLILKADIKDVCTLLDQKSSILFLW